MFQILFTKTVVKNDLPALTKSARLLIGRAIKSRLSTSPLRYGKPLRDSWSGYRRLRVSFYRIIYRVDMDINTVTVVAIRGRKDVYLA